MNKPEIMKQWDTRAGLTDQSNHRCWDLFKWNSVWYSHWHFSLEIFHFICSANFNTRYFPWILVNLSLIPPFRTFTVPDCINRSVHITFIKNKYTCRRLSKYGFINTAIVRLGTDNWIVSTAGSLSPLLLYRKEKKTNVDGPYFA